MATAYSLPTAPEAPQIDLNALGDAMARVATSTATINQQSAREYAGTAGDIASSIGSKLNPQIANEFYTYLSSVNPNWKDNLIGTVDSSLKQVSKFGTELMSGTLPDDVVKNTMSSVMELGFKKGQFGGMAASNVARNLGLTSLQLKTQGASILTDNVSKLSQTLMANTQALIPKTVDYTALVNGMMGGFMGTLTSAGSAQNALVSAAQTNADLLWSSRLTAFNSEIDRRVNVQSMDMWGESIRAQQQTATLAAKAVNTGSAAGQAAAAPPEPGSPKARAKGGVTYFSAPMFDRTATYSGGTWKSGY